MKKMNIDRFKMGLLVLMSSALIACDDSRAKKVDRLETKVRKLEAKVEAIESAFQGVTVSVSKMGLEIEDFARENWKTNVPDVEYEFEQLKRAVSEVEKKF